MNEDFEVEDLINDSFVLYGSFYCAIQDFNEHDFAQITRFIFDFAYRGIDADLSNASQQVKAVYRIYKEQIKASIKNKLNGSKGGAPNGNNNAKKTQNNKNKGGGVLQKQPM